MLLDIPEVIKPIATGTVAAPVSTELWAQWQGPRSAYSELNVVAQTLRYWQSVPEFGLHEWLRSVWDPLGWQVEEISIDDMLQDENLQKLVHPDPATPGYAEALAAVTGNAGCQFAG